MLNVCTLIGRCTRDASVKQVGAKGTPLLTVGIANETGWGDNKKTNFFEINLWGKRADSLLPYLNKGKQIAVSGAMESNKWTDNNGIERTSWVINAQDITLLSDSQSSAPQGGWTTQDEPTRGYTPRVMDAEPVF